MANSYLILDIETVPDSKVWTPPEAPPEKIKLEKKASKGELEFLQVALDVIKEKKPIHDDDLRKALDIAERAENPSAIDILKPITPPEEGKESPFAPCPAQKTIVIGCVWLDGDLTVRKIGAMSIDEKKGGERKLLSEWNNFMSEKKPTIVTWFGRGFDMPVLMYRAFKNGIQMGWYFENKDYRYRYSEDCSLDLCDVMSDFGAVRGGLKLDNIAKLIGLPGKHSLVEGEEAVEGNQVAQLYLDGKLEKIAAYCLSDVVQTAFLFMRWRYLKSRITLDAYQAAVKALLDSIAAHSDTKRLRKLIDEKALLLSDLP